MDYIQLYARFLKKFFKPQRKLKVVFDCSNGTTGKVLKELFQELRMKNKELKSEAIFINEKPDGNFPGHGPNPLAKSAMGQVTGAVKKHKANLGVIFDADGDRVFFVDDLGQSVGADKIGYILLRQLKPKKFAVSIISSWLLKRQAPSAKRQAIISRVGHYFFKKMMRQKKIPLGMEPSGHYYFSFPNEAVWDSGILAAIYLIGFVSRLDTKLSKYLEGLPKYYRAPEMNFRVNNKKEIIRKIEQKYKNSANKISRLDGLTMEFPSPLEDRLLSKQRASQSSKSEGWWLNVRPSGTENLLRINLEATDKKTLQGALRDLKKLI